MSADHVREELPAWLTGELAPARAGAVHRHLLRCDECRLELVEIAGGAGALQDLARLAWPEPVELPRLDVDAGAAAAPARRPRLAVAGAVAAVALVVLGAVTAVTGLWSGCHGGPGGADGRVRLVALGPGGLGAEGVAHMEGTGEAQRMVLTVRGLPPAPSGHFYELWLLDSRGGAFPVGVVPPAGGTYPLPAAEAVGRTAIDVSVEPVDGDTAHSGTSVLRGSLA